MTLAYEMCPANKLDARALQSIQDLHHQIFNCELDTQDVAEKADATFSFCREGDVCAGFFLSYALKRDKYYLWMAGVRDEYRGRGIATHLQDMLEAYARERGYKELQVKTKNRWRNMLLFTIKSGFNIIGNYTDDKGETKIILEKKL